MEASLPFDIKDVHARYELPNGDPYNNPEGNLHHRTETLTGISDPKIFVNFRPHALLFDTDSALIGGGFTLPLGRTEENPYKLAALGKRHEHMQFGDGTFDPLLRLGYFVMPDWWGVGVQGGMQAPLYENDKGYRGAFTADFAVGPLARFSQDLSMALRYHGLYQDRAKWDGEPDLNSGFFLQTVSLTVPVHFSQSLMLAPSAQYTISAKTLGDETFKLKLLFSLTLEYTFF